MASGVKPRVKVPKKAAAGEAVTIKTLISHKMESGQRKDKEGNVIAEEGRRITARHIKQLEKAGITELEVPTEYLYGRVLAKDMITTSSLMPVPPLL